LGVVRNGDNVSATTDLLNFYQAGNVYKFIISVTPTNGNSCDTVGMMLANTASATDLAYVYSVGFGATSIPGNVEIGWINGQADVTLFIISNGTATSARRVLRIDRDADRAICIEAFLGLKNSFIIGGEATEAYAITLTGFVDSALGVGYNPQL
jgi:hypothetical protein